MSNKEINKLPKTKIVATLGPATESEEGIKKLIEAGLSVARLNCSHGDWETRVQRLKKVRAAALELDRPVGILVDLQGPKIRTGTLPEDGVQVQNDENIILTTVEANSDYRAEAPVKKIFIRNYPELTKDVEAGQSILIDDGVIRLKALSVGETEVEAKVIFGGKIKSNKGVNLPESDQKNLASITEKDKEDIVEAVRNSAEFIALSFVKTAEDIIELKKLINECNVDELPIKVIAKIEKPQAVERLDEILDVVDGVMVARGDLGVELEPEKVPMIQKEIISKANYKKKFVITATQMMDSMVSKPFPTRAEVSDVANAILDGTDAVMLSNETAMGSFPTETVAQMARIAIEVETNGEIKVEKRDLKDMKKDSIDDINHLAIAQSVESLSKLTHVDKILVFTCSGKSATMISKLRPNAKIIAATTYEHTYNYLSIVWGVIPVHFDEVVQTTETIYNLERYLVAQGLVEEGETVIVTGGLPIAARGPSNFVKLHVCDGSIKELKEISKELNDRKLGPTIKKPDAAAVL